MSNAFCTLTRAVTSCSAICLLFFAAADRVHALSDKELQAVIDGTDARHDEILKLQLEDTFPKEGTWRDAVFALTALYLNQRIDEANAAILRIYEEFPKIIEGQTEQHSKENNFHWRTDLLLRTYWLFSSNSPYHPGRLTPEAEAALLDMFWRWASPWCKIGMSDPERTWWSWGSENHNAQAWAGFWGVAQVLSQHPDYCNRRYADGTKVTDMAAAFNTFFKRYARERASKGLLWEIASPTYTKYTLQGWYNMAEFASDEILRRRMKMLLDLYWADWAIEQIGGVRGGSRHRSYPGESSLLGSDGKNLCWFHFGLGELGRHPSAMCAVTSTYRPPLCVVDMALDVEGRGTYEYISRRPGLNLLPAPASLPEWTKHVMDPDYGGILRYTYCTPDFIIGASMVEPRPFEDWCAGSAQNRWDGVIFAGAGPAARIFPQPRQPDRGSFYNSQWSVQKKGVLILQKLRTHKHANGQRIWFPEVLNRSEEDGWVFAEAPGAYAAVRVVQGATTWEPDMADAHRDRDDPLGKGMWLACEKEYTPIIIEVVRKSDFADFAAFKRSVKGNRLTLENGVLQYRSQFYKDTLAFYAESDRIPEVNGKPVNFRPKMTYDSPFIQGKWDSGIVTLQKGRRREVLDFNK